MTGGSDTGRFDDEATMDESTDVADEDDDVGIDEDDNLAISDDDLDPTAGASDIGGRAGEPDEDVRGDDRHEVGGGQTGMGKGPTGS